MIYARAHTLSRASNVPAGTSDDDEGSVEIRQ
jgi:hypothetical protein